MCIHFFVILASLEIKELPLRVLAYGMYIFFYFLLLFISEITVYIFKKETAVNMGATWGS